MVYNLSRKSTLKENKKIGFALSACYYIIFSRFEEFTLKNIKFLFVMLFLFTLICFSSTKAFAYELEFYYDKVEELIQGNANGSLEDVINSITLEPGEVIVRSKVDHNMAYKIKEVKITSEEQLIKEMGEDSYKDLTNGQKALVNAYRASQQQSVIDRKSHAYRDCKVNLYDTSDFEGNNDSDPTGLRQRIMETDFWPASYAKSGDIRIGSAHFANQTNAEEGKSTFIHEYSHTLDKSAFIDGMYGLDKTHYIDEITTERAAFKEAWAEYNEMIDCKDKVKYYEKIAKKNQMLRVESDMIGGYYPTDSKVKAKDASIEQLMANECFMATLLYRIHEQTGSNSKGEDKVSAAFYATNGEDNNMSNVIKQFLKDNPEDAKVVYDVVDKTFLGKMTDKEFLDFVGENEDSLTFLKNRNKGFFAKLKDKIFKNSDSKKGKETANNSANKSKEDASVAISVEYEEVNVSAEKVQINNNSGNPFED